MSERLRTTAMDDAAPDAARPAESPHAFLRRVTRPWHDGVEKAFARFDLQTPEGLCGFLLRQAAALVPLERALEHAGVAELLPDWDARRRTSALAADLAVLGLAIPYGPDLPEAPSVSGMLGTLYVLEGSKLGGRVLHRRVAASPDARVRAADSFLGHRHDHGWRSFLARLDAAPLDAGTRTELRRGARVAFAAFHAAARRETPARFADAPTRASLYHRAHA